MIDKDLHDLEVQAVKQEQEERARRKEEKKNKPNKMPIDSAEFIDFPELGAEELMRLRVAQVSEDKVADYFGLSVEELRHALDQDLVLKKIFDSGPGKGKAQIQVTQFAVAIAGDAQVLKHFGEHHLDQKNKVTHEVDDKQIMKWLAEAEAKLGQSEITKIRKIIDAQFEEVDAAQIEDGTDEAADNE